MRDIKFTDADKEEMAFKDTFFRFGVHKVQIEGFAVDEDDQDREFVTAGVINPDDPEVKAEIRMWLHTDGSRKFTFNKLRDIYVHNAPADKKEEARKSFDAIADLMELMERLANITGGEAWIDVYPDPTRTYQNAKGETKNSINTNIYGYEPKLKEELMPKEKADMQQAVKASDYAEGDVPFGTSEEEKAKAGNTVPKSW